VRCSRCGNENPDGNRFCGMCGASLLEESAGKAGDAAHATQSPTARVVNEAVGARPQSPARENVTEVSATSTSSSISGPSFLGLNAPPPAKRAKGSLSIDPNAAPSSRLDYLLEDEEEHKGGKTGRIVLILIALALAAGFGYLRWNGESLPSLGLKSAKPAATQP